MQKKLNNFGVFDFTDKNQIAHLHQSLLDVERDYPVIMKFLESFCGYNTPVLSYDPHEIAYSAGKRDVILTIKSLMRNDVSAEQIAQFYKVNK